MEKHTINAESLDKILSGSKKVSLIDVRRKVDYDASPPQKTPGALWRDPEKIDHWASELPTSQQAVVYCVKGGSVNLSL